MELLEAYDHEFFSAYSLDIRVCTVTHWHHRELGLTTFTVKITGNDQEHALALQATEISIPEAEPGRSPNEKGSYRVSRSYGEFIRLLDTEWRMTMQTQNLVVGKDRKILESGKPGTFLVRIHPVGHRDVENRFYRYILPLGRGYAPLLKEIKSVTVDEAGIARVKARGRLWSADESGTWDLRIDTKRAYLVRHAQITARGQKSPTFVCECRGLLDAELPLGRTGAIKFAQQHYAESVTLIDYAPKPDPTVMETVRQELYDEEKLKRATVMDYREVDSEGVPKIIRRRRGPPKGKRLR
jgi:hypothetical protein